MLQILHELKIKAAREVDFIEKQLSLSSSGRFWITVEGTGKPFIRMPFDTAEFCFEAALELEDTFDILGMIELRPGETFERIEEMVGVWLERDRVAGVWG